MTTLLQNPATDLKRAVPMREALRIMGWRVRSRGRCDCGLCKGSSKGTVAFNDRLWKCHRCGEGGDVFSLIEKAHNCDFKAALKFLAGEARIELPCSRQLSAEERRRLRRESEERERREEEKARAKEE
jgi:DNA primase